MKKNLKSAMTATAAVALLVPALGACSSNKQNNQADSDTIIEATEEVAVVDSLRPYEAAFFIDDANRAESTSAADSTYVQTPSGLKYAVIKEGNGKSPSATDVVTVNYAGWLTDDSATKFDSSYDRGEPTSFPLNGVIAGWTEGLQLMKEGAIYEFYIPANLAYGERGGGPVPPNAPLIFRVELLSVGEPEAPAAQ